MSLNRLGLGFDFIGRDFVSHTMGGIRRQFGLTEGSSKKMAKTVGKGFVMLAAGALTTAVALGAVSGAINLANQAGQFEQQMAAVGAVTRATTADMKVLEKAAIDAGIATQFSPTEAVAGLRSLGTMGFNAAEAATALRPALDLAAGGQISVAQAAQTTASALRVFGLEAEDAAITTDKLLRISNATALQAQDLQLALGTVGRGAALAKQSLDEMLPSIGLVKNTGVDASVAASSVSSALVFMAKNAKKFKKIGVEVVDAEGKFRPFLDVIQDTGKALGERFVKDSDRAAKATELFGRFGVSAYAGITTQLSKGIKDATGNIVKNADAVNHLRKEMANAAGAAAEFREKLLATFEGQKTLLRGTLETMAVVFGKPFAQVFKPFVAALTNALNAVIRFFTSLPEPVQNAIAGIAVAVAVLTAALGAMLTVGGAITLLLPFLSTFIMVLKAMAIAVGGVVLVVGLLAAGIGLAVWMIRNNIGGLGDAFFGAIAKIKLFWRGLTDLITKGGFSEEVSREMSKAENRGIRRFAIQFFQIFYRIKRFFEGIMTGFRMTMEAFEPVFGGLGEAFRRLGEALGELGVDLSWVSGTPSDKFHEAGAGIGYVIASFISGIATLVTGLIELVTWLIKAGSWLGDSFAKYVIWANEKAVEFIDTLKAVWEWLKKISSGAVGKVVSFFMGEEEPRTNQRGLRPAPGKAAAIAPGGLAPAGMPAVAGGMSNAELVQQLAASVKSGATSDDAIRELSRTLEKRQTVVALNIDGNRIGEAVASAERSKRARQGVPVGEDIG